MILHHAGHGYNPSHLLRLFFVALAVSIVPVKSSACGMPTAVTDQPGTFEAAARYRNTAEGCINLNDFAGKTLAIDVSAPRNVSGRLTGAVLLDGLTTHVTVLPAGDKLIVTASNTFDLARIQEFRIRFRVSEVDPRDVSDAIPARWIFRGGQGFGPAQAVLTDGVTEFIRLSCTGGDRDLDPSLKNPMLVDASFLSAPFAPTITGGSGATFAGGLFRLSPQADDVTGHWYGSWILSLGGAPPERVGPFETAMFQEAILVIGNQRIRNDGIAPAYTRLKSACATGVATGVHPSVGCYPTASYYAEVACRSAELGALDREIAQIYGALTTLASNSAVAELWDIYSEMFSRHAECQRGDLECFRGPAEETRIALQARLDERILSLISDRNVSASLEIATPSPDLVDEIVLHGFSRDDVANGYVMYTTEGMTFLLMKDLRSVVVVHQVPEGTDPLAYRVDPVAPETTLSLATVVVPSLVRNFPGRKGRLGRIERVADLGVYHIVAGIWDSPPTKRTAEWKPRTREVAWASYRGVGWISSDGSIGTFLAVTLASNPSSAGDLLAALARSAEIDALRAAALQAERAAERAATIARERALAAEAAEIGFIYKAPGFWSDFRNPSVMSSVFHGITSASDRLILGWAAAYDERCRDRLPGDAVLFESVTVTEWRNGYGHLKGRSTDTDRMYVDPRLAAVVARARERESDRADAMALNALELGKGLPVNWQRLEQTIAVLVQPYADSHRIIRAAGCEGPITRQFLANLLASAGNGRSVRETPILSRADAEKLSDPVPAE